jgi:hypothetical protein
MPADPHGPVNKDWIFMFHLMHFAAASGIHSPFANDNSLGNNDQAHLAFFLKACCVFCAVLGGMHFLFPPSLKCCWSSPSISGFCGGIRKSLNALLHCEERVTAHHEDQD